MTSLLLNVKQIRIIYKLIINLHNLFKYKGTDKIRITSFHNLHKNISKLTENGTALRFTEIIIDTTQRVKQQGS